MSAPGVNALQDAEATKVGELKLKPIESLVARRIARRRPALHLHHLLHGLAAGMLGDFG